MLKYGIVTQSPMQFKSCWQPIMHALTNCHVFHIFHRKEFVNNTTYLIHTITLVTELYLFHYYHTFLQRNTRTSKLYPLTALASYYSFLATSMHLFQTSGYRSRLSVGGSKRVVRLFTTEVTQRNRKNGITSSGRSNRIKNFQTVKSY